MPETNLYNPGEWHVSKHATPDHAPQFGIYAEGEQNDFAIIRHGNAKANAHFIAQAPRLLAAARACLNLNSIANRNQLRAVVNDINNLTHA